MDHNEHISKLSFNDETTHSHHQQGHVHNCSQPLMLEAHAASYNACSSTSTDCSWKEHCVQQCLLKWVKMAKNRRHHFLGNIKTWSHKVTDQGYYNNSFGIDTIQLDLSRLLDFGLNMLVQCSNPVPGDLPSCRFWLQPESSSPVWNN
jgi:hypothetical protein